ncbi:MAG TPA: SET domain-containing protein-lysine N-methyltransferase [Thermomonas sp.]|nr:SET domain-containing protein-lysine N-methyltransferase [Thermomonas sp.]
MLAADPMPGHATAFVREVLMPGGPAQVARLVPEACAFRLRIARSRIHRWGVYADEDIPARRRLIEYTGQRIGLAEAWRRRLRPQLYLFRCSARRWIDGGIGGSGAQYINHGCVPNLVASFDHGRVHLRSLRRILAGEELLLDYQVRGDIDPIPCRCGARGCRGVLNAVDDGS